MSIEPEAGTSDMASWVLLTLMTCACLFACRGLGFVVSAPRAILPGVGVLILIGGLVAGRRRSKPRLEAGAAAFLQMTLFTLLGVVFAYALAARAGPLWDRRLAAADVWLGFDWPAIWRAADAHPAAIWVGGIAYHSLVLQMIVCIVVLSGTRRIDVLRTAVAAAILGGTVTIAISGVVPAMGNVFDPAGYTHLWPSIAWLEHDLITGLRDGRARVLDLSFLMGIVSFPSYHATLPVILAWAQRDVPVLRIVAPLWALLTIAATPLFGGHYAVDVLAGLALAVIAISVAPSLVSRRGWLPIVARPGTRVRKAPRALR